MATKEQIIDVLKTCQDPEIHVDVWTLELVYDIAIEDGLVTLTMTYTTPACPYGPVLVDEIKQKLLRLDGVDDVIVNVVFDPPWKPSEDLRAMFGI